VVGGGPAGAAAVAAARNGASTVLLERYNHLGGWLGRHGAGARRHVGRDLHEISVRGICLTDRALDRARPRGVPAADEWGTTRLDPALDALGRLRLPHALEAASDVFAASFDPDGFKRVALEWSRSIDRAAPPFVVLAGAGRGRSITAWSATRRAAAKPSWATWSSTPRDLDVAVSAGAPHIGAPTC
jgi:hypothetical protein